MSSGALNKNLEQSILVAPKLDQSTLFVDGP